MRAKMSRGSTTIADGLCKFINKRLIGLSMGTPGSMLRATAKLAMADGIIDEGSEEINCQAMGRMRVEFSP
jgi:hypothetical protein